MAPDGSRVGIIVLRVWLEPDAAEPLRVRILAMDGVADAGAIEPSAVVTSVDDACAVVARLLHELMT